MEREGKKSLINKTPISLTNENCIFRCIRLICKLSIYSQILGSIWDPSFDHFFLSHAVLHTQAPAEISTCKSYSHFSSVFHSTAIPQARLSAAFANRHAKGHTTALLCLRVLYVQRQAQDETSWVVIDGHRSALAGSPPPDLYSGHVWNLTAHQERTTDHKPLAKIFIQY